MKKSIISLGLLSLLSIGALAGCGEKKPEEPIETRTEEQIIVDNGAEAVKLLNPALESLSSTGLSYGESKSLTTLVTINSSHQFTVTYSLNAFPGTSYAREYLTLQDDSSATMGKKLVTDAPTSEELGDADFAKYQLKYTMNFKGYVEGATAPKGVEYTTKYINKEICKDANVNVKVLPVKMAKIKDAKSLASGTVVSTYGYIVGWLNPVNGQIHNGVFIQDGTDGLQLYAGNISTVMWPEGATEPALKIGDLVHVVGKISPYNGLFEVKPSVLEKVASKPEVEVATPKVYNTLAELVKKDGEDLTSADILQRSGEWVQINEPLTITSTQEEITALKKGAHWNIKAQNEDGLEITVYINYHIGDDAVAQDAQEEIRTLFLANLGKSFTYCGYTSAYNAIQLTPGITATATKAADCFIFGE